MSRALDAATLAAVTSAHVGIGVFLTRLGFDGGDVLATNAPFPIAWDWDGDAVDEFFPGVGHLGAVSDAQEATDIQAYSLTLELSGVDPALIALAKTQKYQGRDGRLWVAVLDDVSHAIVGVPKLIFRGRMDTMDIALDEAATISLTMNSRLSDWDRARVRRYTNEDQIARFPGDRGLEFVALTTEKEILWGRG